MIDETIKRLDELEAKATKGLWKFGCFDSVQLGQDGIVSEDGTIVVCDNGRSSGEIERSDADFICAIRNAYPALRAEITKLRDTVFVLEKDRTAWAERMMLMELDNARLRKVEAAGAEVLHEWDNAAFTVTSTRKAVEKLRDALASKSEES